MAANARSVMHRKLTNPQRAALFAHAIKRFKAVEAREAEKAAEEALLSALELRSAEYADDIAVFERYNLLKREVGIELTPSYYEQQSREFSNNGNSIERTSWTRVAFSSAPGADDEAPYQYSWSNFNLWHTKMPYGSTCKKLDCSFKLPLPYCTRLSICVSIPGQEVQEGNPNFFPLANGMELCISNSRERHHSVSAREFLEGGNIPALAYNVIKTMTDRGVAEEKLLRAIFRVIRDSERFADVAAIWPEANEIADVLFPPKAGGALVALNEDAKLLICQNLQARGVEGSAICTAA